MVPGFFLFSWMELNEGTEEVGSGTRFFFFHGWDLMRGQGKSGVVPVFFLFSGMGLNEGTGKVGHRPRLFSIFRGGS